MNKDRFRDLLTDLYEKYNPDHVKYIDELVERNHDSPYSAIDSIFMKYNYKSMAHYDPLKSSDEYKLTLIKDYEAGKRPFKEVNLVQEANVVKETERKQDEEQVKATKDEVKKITEEKVTEAKQGMLEQVNAMVKKEMTAAIEEAMTVFRKSEDIDYTVTMDNVGEDVVLPNKKHLAALGINARLIVKGKNSSRPIGLVIKDIAYDSYTSEKHVIVSIHLEKG